jgi:hypothetical protein
MENDRYPMPRIHCGARTRTGGTCRQPAMKNGRCRLHGGKSLSGMQHGRHKHGRRTKEAIETRRRLSLILKDARELLRKIAN